MNQAAIDSLYTRKQQEVLRWHFAHDYFMLINHGAVRTGKTFLDNDIFLSELKRIGRFTETRGIREPQYILAGASIGALERNVLNPIRQKYGLAIKLSIFNAFKLFGVLVCCFGHDDIGKLNAITGMTAYGAYINEATKANDEVLKQIVKRCSGEQGFRTHIVMDTNPDSPEHPIKKDYIDKADGKRIMTFHWRLSDNTFLSPEYVEDIKATTPSGVFTARDIDGLWCTADGMVYMDFDATTHIIERLPESARFLYYFCGVDWGYEHKGAICVFGEADDGCIYLIKEIVKRHMLIDWWTEQANNVAKEFGKGIPFYCDTARPDNIRAFFDAGFNVLNARKEIAAGVERVAKRIKTRTFMAHSSGLSEDGFRKEIYQYAWNEKTGLPIKENDDVMDAIRYGIFTNDYDKGRIA